MKNKTKQDFVDFERGFFIKTSLAAVLISFAGLIINVALDFGVAMYIIPIIAMIIYGSLFYFAKYSGKILITKWAFVVITFIFMNLLWVFNYGSYGPAPYFFILIYTLLIFVFSRSQLIIVTMVLVINITLFMILDLFYPGLTQNYETETARIIDVYTGLIIYAIIIFVLITNAKYHFVKEYEKAKTSDNVKANFLDNISHEIRTPLNAIVGFSSILSQGDVPDDDREEYVKAINESTASLLKTVSQILDVSQIEAGGIDLKPEEVNIRNLFTDLMSQHTSLLKERNKSHIDFRLNLPAKDVKIFIDRTRFEQIFSILLDNSLKFTSDGFIEIGCEMKYSKNIFWIQDTGTGIKEEFKQEVFKSFTRNEKSTSGLYGGTGIGLFLARALVELNSGEMWFNSVYGKGTTFYFSLPRETKFSGILKTNR